MTLANKMKKKEMISRFGILAIVALVAWCFGYVKGNADASYRSAVGRLVLDLAMNKEVEGADKQRAIEHNEFMIATNYQYLTSDNFWYSSIKDQFKVDSASLLKRSKSDAAGITSRVLMSSKSTDEVIRETEKKINARPSPKP